MVESKCSTTPWNGRIHHTMGWSNHGGAQRRCGRPERRMACRMGDDKHRDISKSITFPLSNGAVDLESRPALESVVVARAAPDGVPAVILQQILPTERIGFATRPHPVVLIRPTVAILVITGALTYVLTHHIHPIVAGHHINTPWLDARERMWASIAGGLAGLRALVWLMREVTYYIGFRIVATNRRVLLTAGVFDQRVRPLGNTAMASATLVRGWLGAIFGYGSIVMAGGKIRDVREPATLYREMQAVANGVDGDRWQPALRQTRIP
jgi:hypothetical protein